MKLEEVMAQLESLGNESTRKIFRKHGAPEKLFGVKVADLKKLMKKLKNNQPLALQLFETGNGDAMYLAGLIADPQAMSVVQLNAWAEAARWHMIAEYSVAGVAAEGPHGWECGLAWIESDQPHVAAAGWCTLVGVASHRPDAQLDLEALSGLLDRVQAEIADAPNRVRYTMNGFVIGIGSYVTALTEKAQKVATAIGKVKVDMGGTACKVPSAPEYIQKIIDKGRLGKKRKSVRC